MFLTEINSDISLAIFQKIFTKFFNSFRESSSELQIYSTGNFFSITLLNKFSLTSSETPQRMTWEILQEIRLENILGISLKISSEFSEWRSLKYSVKNYSSGSFRKSSRDSLRNWKHISLSSSDRTVEKTRFLYSALTWSWRWWPTARVPKA